MDKMPEFFKLFSEGGINAILAVAFVYNQYYMQKAVHQEREAFRETLNSLTTTFTAALEAERLEKARLVDRLLNRNGD